MKDEALKLALEALEQWNTPLYKRIAVINKIKEALAQPSDSVEQEPAATKTEKGIVLHVGWDDLPSGTKLYTTPPKREWAGLTDDERTYALRFSKALAIMHIEAKLKEKNFDDKTASKEEQLHKARSV